MVRNLSIPPPARIAIGSANVGGQQVEIFLNPEWARYFESLTTQVTVTAGAVGLPGAPGTTGAAGIGVSLSDGGSSDCEFVPGPPGPAGSQGCSGPPLFLLQDDQLAPDMVPGPAGATGAQGVAGAALFMLQNDQETQEQIQRGSQPPEPANAPTLLNAWTNFGAGFQPAGYWKDAFGVVHLQGLIALGVVGSAAFTLPTGYRPAANCDFAAASNSAFGVLQVFSTGSVIPNVGSNVWFSLEGVTFLAG